MNDAEVIVRNEYAIIEIEDAELVVIDREIISIISEGIQGPPGASADFVAGETPSGAVNGSNATFISAFAFVPESVTVLINGLTQRRITDFNTSGTTTIILSDSPQTGDSIRINYLRG